MEFTDKEDSNIDIAGLGFFSDMMSSIPELFPPGEVIDPQYVLLVSRPLVLR